MTIKPIHFRLRRCGAINLVDLSSGEVMMYTSFEVNFWCLCCTWFGIIIGFCWAKILRNLSGE